MRTTPQIQFAEINYFLNEHWQRTPEFLVPRMEKALRATTGTFSKILFFIFQTPFANPSKALPPTHSADALLVRSGDALIREVRIVAALCSQRPLA